MGRRAALSGLASCVLPLRPAEAALDARGWLAFRARFVQPNGRVIDTGNGGQSHTEGQGWTMLLAQRFGDRETFRQVYGWTARVLRRPQDALHAWRCRPGPAEVVDDLNNATDGDVAIAWALLEAGARWNDPALLAAGTKVAADVLRLLMRRVDGRRLLIPSLRGFEHSDYVVVNLSYYLFPAFPVLAAACPDPAWVEVAADGLALLRVARFGRWGLPPDWLAVPTRVGAPHPAPGWPARFSFDAVRVPLYMSWAGMRLEPCVVDAARWWSDPRWGAPPAWVDLNSGEMSSYPAPAGIAAIARLAIAGASGVRGPVALPGVAQATDYYSAALALLAQVAAADMGLAVR
jgi:endoglucanase